MALGVVNTGMSIYNTAQIKKLYSALSNQRQDMMDGFKHVAHALQEEDHAIHQITMPWFIVLWTYKRSNGEMSLLSQNTSESRRIRKADFTQSDCILRQGRYYPD